MLTNADKTELKRVLSNLLQDKAVANGLCNHIMNKVDSTILAFRKEYLTIDAKTYEDRVEQLELRLRGVLSNALDKFDVNTDKLYNNMHKIAEDKVHLIVNGSLEKVNSSLDKIILGQTALEVKVCDDVNKLHVKIADVKTDIEKVQKKTIHFAMMYALDKHPIRTIMLFTVLLAIVLGTALKIYNVELNIITWIKTALLFFGIKF